MQLLVVIRLVALGLQQIRLGSQGKTRRRVPAIVCLGAHAYDCGAVWPWICAVRALAWSQAQRAEW